MNYRKKIINIINVYMYVHCIIYILLRNKVNIIKSWYLCEDELTWSICLPYF